MKTLAKIKKKGFAGCVKSVKCRVLKVVNIIWFKKYESLPIDEYSIVLESEGDCCDNAYALFDYMKTNNYLEKYKITWLVDHPENFVHEANVDYVKKDIYENFSKCTIRALRTCKWYIYDHRNIMSEYKKREGQTLVYLSHGWGYKGVKGKSLNKSKSKYDYMTATGPLSAMGLSDYLGEPVNKTVITGYPRLDYLFFSNSKIDKVIENRWNFRKYNKVIFWMPTFRQSNNLNISEDYFLNETGLPLFNTIESLKQLDGYLTDNNVLVLFKLHHLQAELPVFSVKFNNIIVVRDKELQDIGIQLYQLIKYSDALISDYSSVSIDYLIADRPIIFTLDDYEEYGKSRGFFPKNAIDYMPGYHVYNVGELKEAIEDIITGKDPFSEDRNRVVNNYHTYKDGNSSKRVLDQFGIIS